MVWNTEHCSTLTEDYWQHWFQVRQHKRPLMSLHWKRLISEPTYHAGHSCAECRRWRCASRRRGRWRGWQMCWAAGSGTEPAPLTQTCCPACSLAGTAGSAVYIRTQMLTTTTTATTTTNTITTTIPFNGLFSRTPGWASTRKVKPVWI